MAQRADIGSKRLISLAPEGWARWVTGRTDIVVHDLLSAEFQVVRRESDVLLRVYAPEEGDFLVLSELQIRYTEKMPRRMRAYAALAEEKYDRPVYPVLVNILPPRGGVQIADRYEGEFMGLRARQDYRVINLWEEEADQAFEEPLRALLPFVPVLKGGGEEKVVREALRQLRADESLREMEPLLAFFASFVLESRLVREIMRWDMAVLRESPWYNEILEEGLREGMEKGLEEGLEQGLREGAERQLLRVLNHRFGSVPPDVEAALHSCDVEQLEALLDEALVSDSLESFRRHLAPSDGS